MRSTKANKTDRYCAFFYTALCSKPNGHVNTYIHIPMMPMLFLLYDTLWLTPNGHNKHLGTGQVLDPGTGINFGNLLYRHDFGKHSLSILYKLG